MTQRPDQTVLHVTSAEELHTAIDTEVTKLIREAAVTSPGGGILVTRHSHNAFSVQLTPEVPFGSTVELDLRVAGNETQATHTLP